MREMGARNVLIKGGHSFSEQLTVNSEQLEGSVSSPHVSKGSTQAVDYLFLEGDLVKVEGEWYQTTATHGTGCTLAAAIAANLALGKSLLDAVEISKAFVNEAIRTAPNIGHGHSPINIQSVTQPK